MDFENKVYEVLGPVYFWVNSYFEHIHNCHFAYLYSPIIMQNFRKILNVFLENEV